MTEEIIAQAAHNNAVWCDAVCSTHSGPGEFYPSCWLNRHGAPEYYPDLVTLTGAADITLQTEALVTLMHDASGRSLAVKDSFNCLGLLAFGFTPLFSAEWLSTAALGTFGLNELKDVQWARITVTLILPAGNRHGAGLPTMGNLVPFGRTSYPRPIYNLSTASSTACP